MPDGSFMELPTVIHPKQLVDKKELKTLVKYSPLSVVI
jgi:hypothetical protein